MFICKLIAFSFVVAWVNASPVAKSWVVVRRAVDEQLIVNEEGSKSPEPRIDSLRVTSQIQLRYARTQVTSRVLNPANKAQEVSFHVVLPETAYISGFVMRIQGKDYEAKVEEKEKAKTEYEAAVSSGQTAAQVATTNARDANQFTVSVNVAAAEKVEFELNYEELLVRRLGRYEHAIHVNPGRVVPNLQIQVNINETLPFKVNVVDLRNDINGAGNATGEVLRPSETEAEIIFSPSEKEQKEFSKDGIQGQFVVQYEVDYSSLEQSGGEIQIVDGYFVHFFAPSNLPLLPKHVVFVLDTSGSMSGEKLEQTKQAMKAILDQLTPKDYFSIIEFNYDALEWDLSQNARPIFENPWDTEKPATSTVASQVESFGPYDDLRVYPTTEKSIAKAKDFVDSMVANGGTNINDALLLALRNAQSLQKKLSSKPAPIIVFLTDGEPTSGTTDLEQILTNVAKANSDGVVSIFSLAFGRGADFSFLKKVSLQNKGFARKIYEASDAALQLQGFFSEIASPLLSDVKFTYVGDVGNVTETVAQRYFLGSEVVVAGRVGNSLTVWVNATSADGSYVVKANRTAETKPSGPSQFLERLWAYLTIKDLIKKSETLDDKVLKDRALNISLKYKFVTSLTSLVVVKPNETSVEDLKPTDLRGSNFPIPIAALAAPASGLPFALRGPSRPSISTIPAAPFHPTTTFPRPQTQTQEDHFLLSTTSSTPILPVIPDWLLFLPHNDTHVTVSQNNTESYLLWGKEVPKIYETCLSPQGNTTVTTCKSPWDCSPLYQFNPDDICVIEGKYIGICCSA